MIVEAAPAKLNLALHVRARRADGYHEIETLFAFCRDGDVVSVELADRNSLTINGPFATALLPPPFVSSEVETPLRAQSRNLPRLRSTQSLDFARDEREGGPGARISSELDDNLVIRAARVFADTFSIGQPHTITLDKQLPIASGIGGGSADAAATLRALARLHGIAFDDPRLFACANGLGSDVPACLAGRTALGLGRGERLRPIEGLPGTPVLLVNPGVPVPTGAVFARWDGIDRGAIATRPLIEAATAGRNDLEPPARAIAPEISIVLETLATLDGVRLARMSGSGATCFALFDDDAALRAGAARVAAEQTDWWRLATVLA